MTGRKSKSNKAASSHSQNNPLCVGQFKLYIGAKIEALDSKEWYQARVVKINEAAHKVLVHFDGWNARHDKWFPFESDSLRPLSSPGEKSEDTQSDSKEHSPGDRVLARWSDSKFYPATICSVVNKNTIEVVFYDGFKKLISKSNIRPDRKRAFETFVEKFKGAALPKLPASPQLPSPADETASPSSNRLKRRHAEPSTMADFVTELPGKRAKKSHPRDGTVAEDSFTQHKDSDTEGQFGTPKIGKKKRYSSPSSSSTPATSPALSGSSTSPSERQGKVKNAGNSLDVSPVAEIRNDDMIEGEKKTKGAKYPVIKPLKKRKPLSSFLKIKLPMKSPSKKKNRSKDEFANEEDRIDEKKILDKTQDHRSSDTRIVKDKYDDAKVSDGKEGVGRMQDNSMVRSRDVVSDGLKENLLEARRKSPFSEHGSIDYSKFADGKAKDGGDRDGVPDGSSKDLDASVKVVEGCSMEKGGKRLPKRERKLTEKGLELQQSIVSKKRHETSCNDSSCGDDHDDTDRFHINTEGSSQIDENKKSESETSRKDVEESDVCLDAKEDRSKKLLDSGDETGSSDSEKKIRCNIKLISERKLGNKARQHESESLLEGKNIENSVLTLESSDKTLSRKEQPADNLSANSGQFNTDLKGQKDSAKDCDVTGKEQRLDIAGREQGLDIAGKEQGLDVAGKEQSLDVPGKEQGLDVVGEEKVTKPFAKEGLNEPEIVGNDSKTDYFEDQYSDVDSEASLVIDIDDEVKDEDSSVCTNESLEISRDSIEGGEERTKVKQRTYPKLKYTLSHEERKGNRVEKLKKARGRKALAKNEKKEVLVEKVKKDESCVSSPLQSLSKLVADKTEVEVRVLDDVDVQVPTSAQSVSSADAKTDQKPEQKTGQKANKPVKQARGPRPRVRMADQFLSMVTQDRPSQIERPISKDLVNERSAKGRPRNRQPFWPRMQQLGPCEESQDQEIIVYPTDINEPLDFSHGRFKEGMTGNLITPPYPNVTNEAPFDQKVSNVKPRKRKLEKSKVEAPKTYGIPCFVPYQSPHFIGSMERQMSPVEQGLIEPRYVKSPYHIESPPNVSIRSGSPLSESPGMLPQRPSPHGEQFVCGIQGPRPLHSDVLGPSINKRSPNPPLPPYPGAPMQFVPGFPNYCRPPGPVHPNTQFSAKISNCPCEECRNVVHSNSGRFAKHPARPECSPARGMPQDGDFLGAVKLEDNILQSKQPAKEEEQDPGFVITNVCSLRDSVKDSKASDVAKTDVLSAASAKHSKEDATTQSDMFSVEGSFRDSKDGTPKLDTLSHGEPVKDSKGETVGTDALSHEDSIQDSKEDNNANADASSLRDSTQDSYEPTSPKAVVDSPREGIADESVVKDHSVQSGHLGGTASTDSRQADGQAACKESASDCIEQLPASSEKLADSEKLSRPSENLADSKPAEVVVVPKQSVSEHIEKLVQSCEKLTGASEKPESAVRDSSFSPANSPSPPAAKLTSFETKKKRLDFITGKLSAQKQTKTESDDKTSGQTGMKIQPLENFTAEPTVVKTDKDDGVSPTETADAPGDYRKESPDISLCSSQTPEMIQQRNVLPEGFVYLDPTVQHPEAHFMTIAGPPASFPVAQRTSTSPEGQILYQYPSVSNPGAFIHPQHSGAFIQIPVDPAVAAVSGFYAPQPHRLVYPPNDIRSHPQFFQTADGRTHMQRFPYGPPLRQVPPPGYVLPREAGYCIPGQAPPPYDPMLMAGAQTRFLPIAPNGRAPLTMCNQQNCSCPLPHASPPAQVMPKPASAPLLGSDEVKMDEELLSKDKPTPTIPQAAVSPKSKPDQKKESLMKGDPRRLTLPLQRLKKVKTSASSKSAPQGARAVPRKQSGTGEDSSGKQRGSMEQNNDKKSRNDLTKFEIEQAKGVSDVAEDEGKENKPADAASKKPETGKNVTKSGDSSERSASSKKPDKNNSKEHVFAPKEFVVEQLNLDEYKCTVKGCEKSFRKSSSLDYHTRYFHSPRVPQRKRNTSSTSLLSPDLASGMLPGSNASSPGTPQPPSHKKPSSSSLAESTEVRASNEDLSSIRSGCTGSVMTDDNMSDREKPDIASSDESDESDLESDGTVSVDDIIRCKCGDCEEQGFMIQCEQCLTWQHGDCVQLSIDTVPRKYVCYVCSNPEGLRRSFKYKNNFDWYRRGILPSVVEHTGEGEGKMANISQASHALMEDISNVMDVLEGIKKKLALLDSPLHSSLRFWKRKPENIVTNDANTTTQNNNDTSKDTASLQSERPENLENASIELKQLEDLTKKVAEQSEELSDVSCNTVNRDAQSSLEQPQADIIPQSVTLSSKPAKKCDPNNSSDNEPHAESSIESDEIERNIAKINLLDHVENIENELNDRMDEIEKSLDLLENEYKKIGDESCENWPRSAFKMALPDVTSIAKHVRLINMHLLDAS